MQFSPRFATKFASLSLTIAMASLMVPTAAFAASVSNMGVILSNNTVSAVTNATLYFVATTGVAAGQTLTEQQRTQARAYVESLLGLHKAPEPLASELIRNIQRGL